MLKKQDKNSMQTEDLIGPGGCMGHPKDYSVIHFLDDSLIDEYSVPMKKLHNKTMSHLFSRVADIRGHKDNVSSAKKTPNKNLCKVSKEFIKFPTFTKYQKTQKESS
jgi:alpha-D-ribose 1-methylphosphonate 5-triphosphate synthase subunit PhnI